jgi:5-methylcytosine-specific restriction protein A
VFDRSRNRFMRGGRADLAGLPKGAAGRALCRWCNLEVPKGRRTFCSEWCVDQWRLRTDASYLRERVFERDRGICAACGCDTCAEWARIRRLRGPKREAALAAWGIRGRNRVSLWDADHVLPVVEGGGECDLDNLRTLCLKCHREATAALRRRRSVGLEPR